MSRRQEMVACLIRAGELLASETSLSAPTGNHIAVWTEQVAAALAAAHMDGELEVWLRPCAEQNGVPTRDSLGERLAQLCAWLSELTPD